MQSAWILPPDRAQENPVMDNVLFLHHDEVFLSSSLPLSFFHAKAGFSTGRRPAVAMIKFSAVEDDCPLSAVSDSGRF